MAGGIEWKIDEISHKHFAKHKSFMAMNNITLPTVNWNIPAVVLGVNMKEAFGSGKLCCVASNGWEDEKKNFYLILDLRQIIQMTMRN